MPARAMYTRSLCTADEVSVLQARLPFAPLNALSTSVGVLRTGFALRFTGRLRLLQVIWTCPEARSRCAQALACCRVLAWRYAEFLFSLTLDPRIGLEEDWVVLGLRAVRCIC